MVRAQSGGSGAAYHPVPAFCPLTEGVVEYRLTAYVAIGMCKGPPSGHFELVGRKRPDGVGSCVQEVLSKPAVVFGEIREYQKGGRRYCGVPSCSWTEGGAECPSKPGKVFAVYINPRGELFP